MPAFFGNAAISKIPQRALIRFASGFKRLSLIFNFGRFIALEMDGRIDFQNFQPRFGNEQMEIGAVTGASTPQLGMKVIKSRRRTGVTSGIITGVEGHTKQRYAGITRIVRNIVHIAPEAPEQEISAPRDSGSMSTTTATANSSRRKKTSAPSPEPLAAEQTPTALPAALFINRRDDLLKIDGIDPATEMALNSIGVRQFADFRRYTLETLAQALYERAGLPVSTETIASQDWIGRAERLATENSSTGEGESTQAPAERSEQLAAPIFAESQPNQPGARRMKKPKPETPNEANDEIVLSIQQVRFSQVDMPAARAKFMRGEIACHVNGGQALHMTTDRVALCTQILAVNAANGEYKLLASQLERFQSNRADYRFQIEFEVPQVGRYQLQIMTFLLEVNPKIAFHQGPILRVVP